jgi:hypothetical protein
MGNSGFRMAETLKTFPLKVKFKWFLIMLVRSSTKILQNWQYLFLNDCDYKTLFLKNNKFRWFFEFGINSLFHVNVGQTKTWLPWAIFVSGWLKFKKSSLKLHVQMICYIIQMMYVKSSTKIPNSILLWWNSAVMEDFHLRTTKLLEPKQCTCINNQLVSL